MRDCHQHETEGWLASRHGMKVKQGLGHMTPGEARLPMHAPVAHHQLDCSSCHQPHDYNTQVAAVDSCIQCHNDDHSNNYLNSKHYKIWQREMAGEVAPEPESAAQRAICHGSNTNWVTGKPLSALSITKTPHSDQMKK